MNKEKQIKKIISNSIKNKIIDEVKLKGLFDEMTIDEIQMFWIIYSSSIAYSEANINIPEWKTKIQEQYFLETSRSYDFYLKNKDSNTTEKKMN